MTATDHLPAGAAWRHHRARNGFELLFPRRTPDGLERYDYSAPRFGYAGQLAYDSAGLVTEYPGVAERIA